MSTLFVSDLHLEAERPDIGNQFIEFLKTATDTPAHFYDILPAYD